MQAIALNLITQLEPYFQFQLRFHLDSNSNASDSVKALMKKLDKVEKLIDIG